MYTEKDGSCECALNDENKNNKNNAWNVFRSNVCIM